MKIPKNRMNAFLSLEPADGLIDDCRYILTFADGYTWNGEKSVPVRSQKEALQYLKEADQDPYFLLQDSEVKSEEKEKDMEEKKEKFDRKKYQVEFSKNNYRFFAFKIRKTEEEIISWIEQQENMSAYVTKLIREDMERSKK